MKYTISRDGKAYLAADDIEDLKETLIALARNNKGISYVVREEGLPKTNACRFSASRSDVAEEIKGNKDYYFKRDILKTSECDGVKIFITKMILGEEKVKF